MTRFLLFPVFFPMLAGLFAFLLGRWQEKARDMFVLSATAMELLLVLTIWTNPELSQLSVAVEGFCALGIRFQAGGFHTLMALLTAAGWLAASVFCREYMVHVRKRNRFYFFWMLTLGATMGVFLSADLFTAFVFFEVMSFTSFVLVIQTEEYQALKAGDQAAHDRIVLEMADEMRDRDVLVLAQASMAHMEQPVSAHTGLPVLSSPRRCVEQGKGMEVNTYRGRTIGEWRQLLGWYKECGGEIITVGSDAHQVDQLAGEREAYALLEQCGFRYVTVFSRRKPEMIAL